MPDYLDAVKALARMYRRIASDAEPDKAEFATRQIMHASNIEAAITEIEACRIRLTPLPTAFGDLTDLPPEVLAELSLTKIDELEQQLRDIVASGDDVGLDQIIIELYRRHKAIHPRRFVMNKLYRMAQKGIINGVEGRKGVYSVKKAHSPFGGAFDDDLDEDVPF